MAVEGSGEQWARHVGALALNGIDASFNPGDDDIDAQRVDWGHAALR
jgi:hypothetical protein